MNAVQIIGGVLLAGLALLLGLLMLVLLWLCLDLFIGTVASICKRKPLDPKTYDGMTAVTRKLVKIAKRDSLRDARWFYFTCYGIVFVLTVLVVLLCGLLLRWGRH